MKKFIFGALLSLFAASANAYQYYHSPGKSSDTAMLVAPNGQVADQNNPIGVSVGDSANLDAAERFRVSEPYGVFEDSRVTGIGDLTWEEATSGVGSGAVWNSNEATVSLTVGTGATDYDYRQTKYLSYVPGKSEYLKMTFVAGAGVTNVVKRVGYFDANDGIFYEQNGTANEVCLRSSTTGTPVDTCIPQAQWNLDRLDGSCTLTPASHCSTTSNPSGLTFDPTKTQLLAIDFLWQGVGRIRIGFQIDGKMYYIHQFVNANHTSVPFMATPSLPLRYEIRNTAASAGGTLKQICVSAESEGGFDPSGKTFSASNGITTRPITTRAPVLAIRLANSFNGKPVRDAARLLHSSYYAMTNNAFCELEHLHGVTATVGGTWTAVDANSIVEYNTGITSITATHSHTVDSNYVLSGQGQQGSTVAADLGWADKHSEIYQNIGSTQSEMFAIYCTAFTGTSDISTELDWVETQH